MIITDIFQDGKAKYSELYVTVCIPPVIIPEVPWGALDWKCKENRFSLQVLFVLKQQTE